MRPTFGGDWRLRIAGVLIAGICLIGAAPSARADIWDWLVKAVSAESEDVVPASLSASDVPPGAIVTGEGEQRVLQIGKDLIELYPGTVVTIEQTDGKVRTVELLQGTLKAKVAKRKKSEPFAVKTNNLVAVVKGTVFEVSASASGSAVSVYEGVVAVKSRGRVGGTDVSAGKTATVQSRDGFPSLGDTPVGGAPAATGAAPAAKSASAGHPTTAPKPNEQEAALSGKPAKASKGLPPPGKPAKPGGLPPGKPQKEEVDAKSGKKGKPENKDKKGKDKGKDKVDD